MTRAELKRISVAHANAVVALRQLERTKRPANWLLAHLRTIADLTKTRNAQGVER